MDDIFAEMEEDALTEAHVPTDKELQGIAQLANKQLAWEMEIQALEERLKDSKAKLLKLQTVTFPSAMKELDMTSFTVASTGIHVEIAPFVAASISEARKKKAHKWLVDNKHGDLIKSVITVNVGKDKKTKDKIAKYLIKSSMAFDTKEAVHPGTLKAFVKEQVEKGNKFPLELFGAFLGQKSTITKKG